MTDVVTVISGPTAVGKGTVVKTLKAAHPEVWVSVSATTRSPRPGEIDGVDYLFVTPDEFDRLVEGGGLLEWATVHGCDRYGTPARPVEEALATGKTVILEIDLQGALQVKEHLPDARLLFLAPPSWEVLVERLIGRGTETPEAQQRRLNTARLELAAQSQFDEVIVNDRLADTVAQLVDSLGL